jgi:LEA14-like dessication related protein
LPTIAPEKAVVTSVGPAGVGLNVELGVDNPNGIELSGRSLTAKVVLDGTYDLGTVSVPHPFRLAPRATSHLAVPLMLPWTDISILAALAAPNRSIPYDVDGTVNVGAEALNADVPFHLGGVITHQQLIEATLNSIPSLPGILR